MPDARKLYASIIRLLVQLIVLLIVNWVLTELPMIKAITIPDFPIAIKSLISLAIGIIAIAIILLFRKDFVPKLKAEYPGFPQLSTIVFEALSLVIIIIAYSALEGCIRPLMKQYAWLYPVVFLAVAIWPLYMLVLTMYRSSGPIADWASTRLAPAQTRSIDSAKCPSCGKFSPPEARFCTSCGTSIATSPVNKCAACGAINRQQDKYCASCGALIDENDQYDTRVSVD